jgi:hypothetical protein
VLICDAWVIQRVCGGISLRWKSGGWRRRDYCDKGLASPRSRESWAYPASRLAAGRENLENRGVRGLRKAGRTGRPAKLIPAQLRDLERALKRGPEAFGFASGPWTASRVRDLIEYMSISGHGGRQASHGLKRSARRINWVQGMCWRRMSLDHCGGIGHCRPRTHQHCRQANHYPLHHLESLPSSPPGGPRASEV